jgi:hypothetical protein
LWRASTLAALSCPAPASSVVTAPDRKSAAKSFEVEPLSPTTLRKVRVEALKPQKNAHEVSKNVYAQTAPAKAPSIGADQ